jgi:hypothetical protein
MNLNETVTNQKAQQIAAEAALALPTHNINPLGIPGDYVRRTTTLWNAYLGTTLSPAEVGIMLMLVDVAMMSTGDMRDETRYRSAIIHMALAGQKAADELAGATVTAFGEGGAAVPEARADEIEAAIAGITADIQVGAAKRAARERAVRHGGTPDAETGNEPADRS